MVTLSATGRFAKYQDYRFRGSPEMKVSTPKRSTNTPRMMAMYWGQMNISTPRTIAIRPPNHEPAAGMNPQETDELTEFIRETRENFGLTVFLIEHHMDLVMDISDRIYVIDFGKQIAAGVPSEIQNDQRVIDAYLGVDDDE